MSQDDWKKNASWLTPKYSTHEVGGEELKFYPVSVKALMELRVAGAELAEALSVLFESRAEDNSQNIVYQKDGKSLEAAQTAEISPALAEMRSKERAGAIKKAMEIVLDPSNVAAFGDVLVDSLRDAFPDTSPKGRQFMEALPLPTLGSMLIGLVKANAGVFGPFEGKAQELAKVVVDRVTTDLPGI